MVKFKTTFKKHPLNYLKWYYGKVAKPGQAGAASTKQPPPSLTVLIGKEKQPLTKNARFCRMSHGEKLGTQGVFWNILTK